MNTKKLKRCCKRKRKIYSNNEELQDDYFSIRGLQTYNFVKQSKDNCKNLDGLGSLRISIKLGWFFQNVFKMKNRICRAFSLFKTLKPL